MSCISFFDFIYLTYVLIKYKTCRCVEQRRAEENTEFNLKETFKRWCLKSNIHGISNLIQTKHVFIKLLYIGALLAALIYCSITLVENYSIYVSNQITSKFSIIQHSNKTLYPAFSFCSFQPFDTKIFLQKHCFGKKDDVKTFNDTEISQRNFYNLTFCYTLNLNDSDLAFISDNGESEKCQFILNTSKILFIIHNQNEMIEYGNVFPYLHPGEELSVGLSKYSRKTLPQPYSFCTDDWINETIYKFFKNYHPKNLLNITYKYNPKMCKEFCTYFEASNKCNNFSAEKLYNDVSIFDSCAYEVSLNYRINQVCEKKCADTCETESYDYNYVINLNDKNQIIVYVYFDDGDIIEINDIPIIESINKLIGSVG